MPTISSSPGVVVLGDNNKNVYLVDSTSRTVKKATLSRGTMHAGAAYYGGIAYVGESNRPSYSSVTGLHAFDVNSATDLWGPTGVSLSGSVDASPVISQDLVLYVATSAGMLYAFDVQNPSSSQPLWSLSVFSNPSEVIGLLLSDDGSELYIISTTIYAVALQARSTPAKSIWRALPDKGPVSYFTRAAICNDQYIVAVSGHVVYGFDTRGPVSDGVLQSKWHHAMHEQSSAPMNLDCVNALVVGSTGTFEVVEMSTGKLVGTFSIRETWWPLSCADNGVLFDGQSIILPCGTIRQFHIHVTQSCGVIWSKGWEISPKATVFNSNPLSVAGTILYAVSDFTGEEGAGLWVIDAITGTIINKYALGNEETCPYSPPQLVPYTQASSTGLVSLLLDGHEYFTTMKNLLIAAKNGDLNSGANPPSPPTFGNLVAAVGAAGKKAYVLMWDESSMNHCFEQGAYDCAMSMLSSAQSRSEKLMNQKSARALDHKPNVDVYLEPYPDLKMHSYWSEEYLMGRMGVLSQHQKLAVFRIGGTKLALVSGMNIGPPDYDSSSHPMDAVDSAGNNTYNGRHDTAVLLQGPVVDAVEAEFDRRWAKSGRSSANPGTTSYVKIAGWAIAHDMCLDGPDVCSGGRTPTPFQNPSLLNVPMVPISVLVTHSDDSSPIRQIQEAVVAQIRAAQNYVYIENFTLHDIAIVEALAQKLADTKSSCKVIIMLPHPAVGEGPQQPMIRCTYALLLLAAGAWDELTYDVYSTDIKDGDGYPINMEVRTGFATILRSEVTKVQWSFGKSVYTTRVFYEKAGVEKSFFLRHIASVVQVNMTGSSRLFVCSPARYFGTVQVNNTASQLPDWSAQYRGMYIHSKLALFDDTAAIIGSANFNGRSMMHDGEMSVLVKNPERVAAIRSKLFNHWNVNTLEWYYWMDQFATKPKPGSIGALPLAFSAIPARWPRKIFRIVFDSLGIDPGGSL